MEEIELTLDEKFVSITQMDGPVIMIFCKNSTYGIKMANVWETD